MKSFVDEQETPPKIQLAHPTAEKIAAFAVWRVDYYICTGIAYAKSLGKTPEEFAGFVGLAHSWESMRGQGLEPPVQLLNFVIKSYEDGEFEITSQSENTVEMHCNRPYARFFDENAMLGISLDEFETCLWHHIAFMARRIGLDFSYRIEGNLVMLSLSQYESN